MPSFHHRSNQKELLDRDDIPFADIKRNMQELDVINSGLGGHAITIKGIKTFSEFYGEGNFQVVEIGCGGGDNLRAIKVWAERHHFSMQFTGIDINPECIAFAKDQVANSGINFICSDYRKVEFESKPHVIFSSLFSHHFTDEELALQLQWMKQNSNAGFFVNDLHRHPAAYYSIQFLTKLFSKSYLVKNDAPLSVLRGFKRKDWQVILEAAGIDTFNIQWKWAFRWLIIVSNQCRK